MAVHRPVNTRDFMNEVLALNNFQSHLLLLVASMAAAAIFGCTSTRADHPNTPSTPLPAATALPAPTAQPAPTALPAAAAISTAPAQAQPAAIDWVNFIRFGDIEYLASGIEKEPPLQEEDLGPQYGRIFFQRIGYMVESSNNQGTGEAGEAAYLEVGTPIYTVEGYKPEIILAAKSNNGLFLYLVHSNPHAEIGSDLWDLEGKVEYISVNSPQDGKTEIAAINDPSQIDGIVRMILDAPVDQKLRDSESDVYFLAFHLKDGINVTTSYRAQSSLLGGGVKLPGEFRSIIEDTFPVTPTKTPNES
jgi:hypothetical protein